MLLILDSSRYSRLGGAQRVGGRVHSWWWFRPKAQWRHKASLSRALGGHALARSVLYEQQGRDAEEQEGE